MVPKDTVYFYLWGTEEPEDAYNTLKVQVSNLRRKFKATRFVIESIWDEGYRLNIKASPEA